MGACCGKPEGKVIKTEFMKGDPAYICVIGDGGVGKTAILSRQMKDEFDIKYLPTIFDDYQGPANLDGVEVSVCLRDTAGQEAYDAINQASFNGCHVFLLCFAMQKGREASLSNAQHKWHKQLQDGGHLANGAKIILVGTQKDMETFEDVDAKASAVVKAIGAVQYIQTSALMPKDQGGIPELFEEAYRAAFYQD